MTFFVVGMGAGTFFMGPLSDAYGRKPVVYAGLAVYALGAVLSWMAPTLEWMLAARVLQGLGARGHALCRQRSFATSIVGGPWPASCR